MIRSASCFSGIGGAELALPEAHWLWSAEIDLFANAVRETQLGGVNIGNALADDFLARAASFGPLDLLVGGPPCQDFSVAGLRAGLEGARGNLTLRWVQIAHALRPRWLLTENVPGWLSVNKGHAFGAFLAGLVGHDTAFLPPKGCGGQWTRAGMVAGPIGRAAWRILDAQYFGLAQRRQRVFVIFCHGDRDDPAAVLFEPASLRGHPAPGREAREGVTSALRASSSPNGHGHSDGFRGDGSDNLIADPLKASYAKNGGAAGGKDSVLRNAVAYGGNDTRGPIDVATARNAHAGPHGRLDFESETFITHSLWADGFDASEDGTGRGTVAIPLLEIGKGSSSRGVGPNGAGFGEAGDPMFTLQAGAQRGIAYQTSQSGTRMADTHATLDANNGSRRHNGVVASWQQNSMGGRGTLGYDPDTETLRPIKPQADHQMLQLGSAVRRLTPRECERLQGFPDDWTAIQYRGKPASDGPRYRALGNAFAVPVVRWIAKRMVREHEAMFAESTEIAP